MTFIEVPADSQVYEARRGHKFGIIKVYDDAEVCAEVDEAQAGVSEVLAVSGEEEPLVDILERHEVKVLACVRL